MNALYCKQNNKQKNSTVIEKCTKAVRSLSVSHLFQKSFGHRIRYRKCVNNNYYENKNEVQ